MALAAAAAISAGWVVSAGAAQPEAVLAHPAPGIECRCRANGRTYELGARICLRTPSGYRVAECRMQQNVSSWTIGSEDCSVSAARASRPATIR
jgi:hypothetical protein